MSLPVGILMVLGCLLIQAFFTATEMALVSSNRLRIRHLSESGNRRAMRIQALLDHPEILLSTTLVGTNLFLVLGATVGSYQMAKILGKLLGREFQSVFPLIATAVMLPLVLIFAEIVPKTLVRLRATEISLALCHPLRISYILLFPLIKVVSLASRGVIRVFGKDTRPEKMFESDEDIKFLMEEGLRQGALTEEERRMISRVFDFGETQAEEVMVPLIDVALAPEGSSVADIRAIVARTGHTRIPIYRERVDRIIGTVEAGDLLTASASDPIGPIIRKPFIVPESKPLERLLEEMRESGRHLGIVVDEYGGVSGIVTMENVLEEIFGDIRDEYDQEEDGDIRYLPDAVDLSGRVGLDELNEELGLDLREEREEETVAGFVIDILERIPKAGDRLSYAGHEFLVTQATDRRLVRLEIRGPAVDQVLRCRLEGKGKRICPPEGEDRKPPGQ